MIANEFNVFERFVTRRDKAMASFSTCTHWFEALVRNSVACAKTGRYQAYYSYGFPTLKQGTIDGDFLVLGDKKGGIILR